MASEQTSAQTSQDQTISVRYGPYNLPFRLGGRTVGDIKKELAEDFNIPADAQGKIGKLDVADDYVVPAGASLVYVKQQGDKG